VYPELLQAYLSVYLSIYLYMLTCDEVVPAMMPVSYRFHMCALSLSGPICLPIYLYIYLSIYTSIHAHL